MYEKLLALVDKDVSESRRKSKLSLPRVAMLQGESVLDIMVARMEGK